VATDLAAVMDTWLRGGVPSVHGFREVHVPAPPEPLRPEAKPCQGLPTQRRRTCSAQPTLQKPAN
jgi:hypothetical protein